MQDKMANITNGPSTTNPAREPNGKMDTSRGVAKVKLVGASERE